MAHADSLRINIAISYIHRLTTRILDVSNAFKIQIFPFTKELFFSTPPYYLDWFEIYHLNVPLNLDNDQFYLQCMNGIQGTNPSERQWNRLLDAVVTILKYNKITIDHTIYINFITGGTVSYLTVSTDDVINTTNN